MSQNGHQPPAAGVPGPTLKMFLTQVEAIPCTVPAAQGQTQPGITANLHSGDLSVQVLFPADHVEGLCLAFYTAAQQAQQPDSGIIIPSVQLPKDLKKDDK